MRLTWRLITIYFIYLIDSGVSKRTLSQLNHSVKKHKLHKTIPGKEIIKHSDPVQSSLIRLLKTYRIQLTIARMHRAITHNGYWYRATAWNSQLFIYNEMEWEFMELKTSLEINTTKSLSMALSTILALRVESREISATCGWNCRVFSYLQFLNSVFLSQ